MREKVIEAVIDCLRRRKKLTALLKRSRTLQKVCNNSVTGQKFKLWCKSGKKITVSIDKILRGGEGNIAASKYARVTGNLMRPSTPFSRSPHVKLLEQYLRMGDALFKPETFRRTEYCQNALEAIDILGRYFGAKCEVDVREHAKNFVSRLQQAEPTSGSQKSYRGGSLPGIRVVVRAIRYSDCYEVVDGNHRLSIAYVKGERNVQAICIKPTTTTPLQDMLLDVLWLKGKRELYQPIESPELKKEWVLVRKCTDRLDMMQSFLNENGFGPPTSSSYLDIGSSYGWFVSEMGKVGYEAIGVESDPIGRTVGLHAYGLPPEKIVRSECVRFLKECDSRFDIVSCFSVFHHFLLGKGVVEADEFIELVDKVTSKVLFFDTGQSNEAWFKDSLLGWDPDFIENWIKEHSSLKTSVRLGVDSDRIPPFSENYSRTIFAFTR